jgi:hypothetical protein
MVGEPLTPALCSLDLSAQWAHCSRFQIPGPRVAVAMALYGPPPNVSVGAALHLIFTHYCSPWKSAIGTLPDSGERTLSMDGMNFARMCKEAPDLNKFIGRTDIDLIFSKTKPRGIRRLEFDHFLDTLLELALRIYPDEEPTIALANFLARFIFSLFDQPCAEDGVAEIERILDDLVKE